MSAVIKLELVEEEVTDCDKCDFFDTKNLGCLNLGGNISNHFGLRRCGEGIPSEGKEYIYKMTLVPRGGES